MDNFYVAKQYVIVIKLPKEKDFKTIVLPIMDNMELSVSDNTAMVLDGKMWGVFSSKDLPPQENFANMWLKFDVSYLVFDKEELDKAIAENRQAIPLFEIEGISE